MLVLLNIEEFANQP